MYWMRWFWVSLALQASVEAVLEYETDEGWKMALPGVKVHMRDIRSVLVHTTDSSTLSNSKQVSTLHCVDSTTGLTTWFLQLPRCSELFHERNCVHCVSKRSSCCSLDLECSSCIQQHHIEIRNPRLLCDSSQGDSLRSIDPSSCVLQLELSQSTVITATEIGLSVWIFIYNLGLILAINAVYRFWVIKLREYMIAASMSLSILFMFEFYLYLQSWVVLLPFSVLYVFLCLVSPYRIFSHHQSAKSKKEQV